MKKSGIFILLLTLFVACGNHSQQADAYGNFEAEEVLVSSESNGKIEALWIKEGDQIQKNKVVALMDTTMPWLQLNELDAQKQKVHASLAQMDAQLAIYKQQKDNLLTDQKRIERLLDSGASTQKQLDDINGAILLIDKQMLAAVSQKQAIAKELGVIQAKKRLLDEQLNKCYVKNPVQGTVLEKYAEAGEITAAGRPLYKIAPMDQLILRAYVSGSQLHRLKTGNTCQVRIDKGTEAYETYEGTLIWIAPQAEFTPKIIQTKEERVHMVYAIKVQVPNKGSLKIGMPGEVIFE
ncbi:MAG: HlyD family secretion protein [Salinivirgaceae bacterium]